jgi:hypothetical protein
MSKAQAKKLPRRFLFSGFLHPVAKVIPWRPFFFLSRKKGVLGHDTTTENAALPDFNSR